MSCVNHRARFLRSLAIATVVVCLGWAPLQALAASITNTGTARYQIGSAVQTINSNTVTVNSIPPPAPAVVQFSQYVAGSSTIPPIATDGGLCQTGPGVFALLPPPMDLSGHPINAAAATIQSTHMYHSGEAVFVTLADANRNLDPTARDVVELRITTDTGDEEILRLQETGPNTGLFAAAIQTVATPPQATSFDCRLSVKEAGTISANYTDSYYPTDTAEANVLIDPFGIVFNSSNGVPVNAATVTLLNTLTGQPAQVFGDDGVSAFPSTLVSGTGASDSSGKSYVFPPGGFRFPFVLSGNYRLVITPPGGYTAPSTVSVANLASLVDSNGNPYSVVAGSFGDVFALLPGPALKIDIPVDPIKNSLLLEKSVSNSIASAGDFLRYHLVLTNLDTAAAAPNAVITDELPLGMRYRHGSRRIGGNPAPDPAVSRDGRTLTIPVGTLAASGSIEVSYVVLVGADAIRGQAVNHAHAIADGGVTSNQAQSAVQIREAFFRDGFTIEGRVLEGNCGAPWSELKGVPSVRLLMEDGTYILTDSDGRYHFEGVRPGGHVVQIDLDSLPSDLEVVSCVQNSRFAGRTFSQFVEAQGGMLWRADFYVKPKAPQEGSVAVRLQSALTTEQQQVSPILRQYTFHALFESLSTRLPEDKERVLDMLVAELRGVEIDRIEVTGHTDNVRIAPRRRDEFPDNYALSRARASAVADYLRQMLQLDPRQVHAVGRGPDLPVADNRTEAGRAENRRVELVVYGRQASHEFITTGGLFRYRVNVNGGKVPVQNVRVLVMLPEGVTYMPGTSTLDGKAVADPSLTENIAIYNLGDLGADWEHLIEFSGRTAVITADSAPAEPELYTFRGNFDTLKATLKPEGLNEIDALAAKLRPQKIDRIEVIGHTDDLRIASRHRNEFPDNYALSRARASAVADYLRQSLGLLPHQVNAVGRGPDDPVADNRTETGRAENRRVELRVYARPAEAGKVAPMACPTGGFPAKASTLFDTELQKNIRTTPVEIALPCPLPNDPKRDLDRAALPSGPAEESSEGPEQTLPGSPENGEMQPTEKSARLGVSDSHLPGSLQSDSGYRTEKVLGRSAGKISPVLVHEVNRGKRQAIPDDVTAAGGNTDWMAGRTPGVEWLFPPPDHNPRAPTVRVAIKHAPDQTVVLKQEDGAVDPRSFDGTQTDASGTFAVSVWRGLPLKEGDNILKAEILDRNGAVTETLSRTVHYANQPVRAEIVLNESILVADGIHKPVIAVRLFDRNNRPVRSGVTGGFEVNPPYVPAIRTEEEQQRQLAGLDRFRPHFRIEGDEGVAYIELSPTTVTGLVLLNFEFPDGQASRQQELRAWLEAEPRDWVVVGFAQGTLGYETLKGNMQALEARGHEDGTYTDGQVRLYAKGRVLGQWLLTLAYDTDKPADRFRRESLFGTIDPNRFYTLYGDGSEQRHDAASRDKLYLKMERREFYALFGDYETGLTQTQLSRYNRSLTGFKTEYHGEDFNFSGYAAETDLNFARDEIQGDGTSGLYHLSNGNIVMNSEKIRIETRDRLQSERILQSRNLLRYLDYEIDYDAGTIFFRQPINSRDQDFNPNFIVAEYETFGPVGKEWNAGGRIGSQVWAGRLSGGLTYIRDANNLDRTNLGGMDMNLKLGTDTQLRFEFARTDGQTGAVNHDGNAHLIELEHHTGRLDTLIYTRRQEAAFGLNQQNASETGTVKTGLDGRLRLTDHVSLQGQVYRQDYLLSDASRDAGNAELAYRTEMGGVHGGTQIATDTAANGDRLESRQATLGANRFLLDKKLELQTQAEIGLAGKNDSTDFPDRYELSASYLLTDDVRMILAQEFTHGDTFDSSTTRVGLQAVPWKGARLTSTLNQSQISEYGPRTFGQMGLTQAFLVGERWGFDLSADSTRTLHESRNPPLILNPNHPVASGGVLGNGSWTEDFVAFSGGATYRSELWSWNGRAETRQGQTTDRYGLTTGFLRQARSGIAFSLSGQAFQTDQKAGPKGQLADLGMSWAYRPLASRWSILEKLELKYEELTNGTGDSGSGLFGNTSLAIDGNARSRRIVNNIVFNRVSQAWTESDRQGNLFELNQRHQWSFYYGAKYVLDRFDEKDYVGYTDLVGLEWRYDLTRLIDLGLRTSVLHAWEARNFDFTAGPMIGASPFENAWITVGYNFYGFRDRDFGAANYTAQGVYIQMRIKFDQQTRFKIDRPYASETRSGEDPSRPTANQESRP